MLLGQRENGTWLDIPDDDERGVVGCVPQPIPVTEILDRQAGDVVGPSDHGIAIRAVGECQGLKMLLHPGPRLIVRAHAPLLDHDLLLLDELGFEQLQIAHAIGL